MCVYEGEGRVGGESNEKGFVFGYNIDVIIKNVLQ